MCSERSPNHNQKNESHNTITHRQAALPRNQLTCQHDGYCRRRRLLRRHRPASNSACHDLTLSKSMLSWLSLSELGTCPTLSSKASEDNSAPGVVFPSGCTSCLSSRYFKKQPTSLGQTSPFATCCQARKPFQDIARLRSVLDRRFPKSRNHWLFCPPIACILSAQGSSASLINMTSSSPQRSRASFSRSSCPACARRRDLIAFFSPSSAIEGLPSTSELSVDGPRIGTDPCTGRRLGIHSITQLASYAGREPSTLFPSS